MNVEEGVELARFTTLGTGGPARAFARPESEREVEELLQLGGRATPSASRSSGSARTSSRRTTASTRSSSSSAASSRPSRSDGDLLRAGGGAANAVALHRARAAGLGGFEFACAIPGTIGGGVWMNGGAYGGDFASVLERALVATADGSGWLTPAELGLSYRHSELRHGQVVLRAELRLRPRPPEEIKAEVRELNARRKAAQPTNRRTFGSVFKNPEHELSAGRMLEACGLKGHRIGGAQISPKHANFIENADGATTADALALMAEARRRAHEQFGVELDTRSSSSASSSCPTPCRRDGSGDEQEKVPAGPASLCPWRARRPALPRRPAAADRCQGVARPVHADAALARRRLQPPLSLGGYALARETPSSRSAGSRSRRLSPVAAQVRTCFRRWPAHLSSGSTARAAMRRVEALPTVVSASYDRDFRTRCGSRRPGAAGGRSPPRSRQLARLRSGTGHRPLRGEPSSRSCHGSGLPHTAVRIGAAVTAASAGRGAAARLAEVLAACVASSSVTEVVLVADLRPRLDPPLGDAADVGLKVAVAAKPLGDLRPARPFST